MIYHKINNLSDLPRRTGHSTCRMHHFCSAYYPNYAAAARRFRELTQQEPGNVYEYTAPTQIGGAEYTTWYFEISKDA